MKTTAVYLAIFFLPSETLPPIQCHLLSLMSKAMFAHLQESNFRSTSETQYSFFLKFSQNAIPTLPARILNCWYTPRKHFIFYYLLLQINEKLKFFKLDSIAEFLTPTEIDERLYVHL